MQERIIDGRYRICGRIGQGGMSTVYLAEELQTKEQVALKWVRRAQMRRFGISEQDVQREAELMRGIDHPALPRIREQFVSEEGCIIVMDRVKGQTLADILHRDGTLSVRVIRAGEFYLCPLNVPHNSYLAPDTVAHTVKYGTDLPDTDWVPCPHLDKLCRTLDLEALLKETGQGSISDS